jgi:putative PIN family toxin of toxin-antitoxin system
MRYVFDTDVLVAGLRSQAGASRRLLVLLHHDRYEAVASVAMMLEYEAVLKRTENLDAFGLTADEVDRFLDSLSLMMMPVTPFFLWRPQLRDPADEHVLEAAVNGHADAIITFNQRHFLAAARRFGIATLKPGDALRRLGTWQP